MTAAWSAGWGSTVELGDGQARIRELLLRSIRHPSRSWHAAPPMRELGRWTSVTHREIHRLAALGVIAIQTTRGARGGTRFTFGVRFWRRSPIRRGLLGLMRPRRPKLPAVGQIELGLLAEPERRPDPVPRSSPAGPFDELMARAGFVRWWRE